MKESFLLFSLVLFSFASMGAPKIKQKTSNSAWRTASTWDLNRVPVSNDTVIIPAGNVLIVDDHQNLQNEKLIVMVYGTLQFVGSGKLTVNQNSAVFVQVGGIVDGNGSPSQRLRIGSQTLNGEELQVAAGQEALLLTATSTGYDPIPGNSGFYPFTVLPVTFSSFTIAAKANGIMVQRATAQEQDSKYFDVERSSDGRTWTWIGSVNAAGNSTTTVRYSLIDPVSISGVFYYRIKQVDMDGRFVHTAIRLIKKNDPLDIKITSAYNKLAVQFSQEVKGAVEVRVVSMSGQIVTKETLNQPVGQIMVDKKGEKGYHVVIVTNQKDVNVAQKVNL